MTKEKVTLPPLSTIETIVYVNLYEKDNGKRFISKHDYSSYEEAFKNRDDLKPYLDTVVLIKVKNKY